MPPDKRKPTQPNNGVSIGGDVVDSVVVMGNNNQTIFQKIINYIFPSEKETLEQRNRRILLGHVENAWIKGLNYDWKDCRITLIGSLANLGSQANHENQGKESICSMKI
ncbi:MAG: hypothetical protein AB1403_26100 [Candidatus Riflebacteria bacterium]